MAEAEINVKDFEDSATVASSPGNDTFLHGSNNLCEIINTEVAVESQTKEAIENVDEYVSSDSKLNNPGSSKEEEEEWLDIIGSGHLKKKVIVKGIHDSRPHRGDTVVLDIIGKLEDGKEFERLSNVKICIGDAEVIQGLEYTLPLMDTGETAQVIVSPRFGFGTLGDLPRIPKDATLNYTITIKEVIEIKDINEFTLDDRIETGSKKKDRGNWWYQRKEYNLAIQCYRKALQYFEQDLNETNDRLKDLLIKTYNNLSVAHFNLEAYDSALTAVNKVLKLEPENIKAVYRKVKILKALGELDDAISIAKKALKNKHDSPALQDEFNMLIELKKKSTMAQKDLYRKMFKTSDQSDKKECHSKKSLMSFSWKLLGVLTVAVGIIGAAAIKYKY